MKQSKFNKAETVDTYTQTPDTRSMFSASREEKAKIVDQSVVKQPVKLDLKPIVSEIKL